MTIHPEQFANDIIRAAIHKGADQADVFITSGRESEVKTRMRELENIKEAISQGYGLRVFKDKKLGFFFGSNFTKSGLEQAAEGAVRLAAQTTEDQFNGLPDQDEEPLSADFDLFDPQIEKITTEWKIEACQKMESAMFEYDSRISNSEGAGFFDGSTTTYIANSFGRNLSYKSSFCYMVCQPVARENDKLQGGWWFSFKRNFSDLQAPETIAERAAERTVRMLGARTPRTARVPVVFDNVSGLSVLNSLSEALNGKLIYRKASYLAGKLGKKIASSLITIVDDGVLKRGLASAPFDGEGAATSKRQIISRGELVSYMYDSYTARKSGVESTGNAQRESSSLPSIGPFNFYLENGEHAPADIIGSVKEGLFLTNLMGFGANSVTGDYSLGASGIWIENGELTYPVEGITVASNILEMLQNIDMVGNDLEFLGPISSPSFRVARMTVSGA